MRSSSKQTKKELQRARQIINAALETIDLALRQLPLLERAAIAAEGMRRLATKQANALQGLRELAENDDDE